MSNSKAIEVLEAMSDFDLRLDPEERMAIETAIADLHAQQGAKSPCAACGYGGKHLDAPPCTECPAHPKAAEKNEPLTMEELMGMNGQPVWLDDSPNGWKCFIVNLEYPVENGRIWSTQCGVDFYGRATDLRWLSEGGLYRHPPKEYNADE